MQEHNNATVSEILRNHSEAIKLLNIAVTSAVSTLIYAEYIRNFKKTIRPVLRVSVPETSLVGKMLQIGSTFSNELSDTLLDMMYDNHLIRNNTIVPELLIFRPKYMNGLKAILESSIIPNIARYVPPVLRAKFALDIEGDRTFYEDSGLDIFDRQPIGANHFKFIADQAVLQLLTTIPTTSSELTEIHNNYELTMPVSDDHVLSIGHPNAISVIHINAQILENAEMMDLISFVTDSNFKSILEMSDMNDSRYCTVRSNVYNQLIAMRIIENGTLTINSSNGE